MFKEYIIIINGEKYFPEIHINGKEYILTEIRSRSVVRGLWIDDPDEIVSYWKGEMEKQIEEGITKPKFSKWT